MPPPPTRLSLLLLDAIFRYAFLRFSIETPRVTIFAYEDNDACRRTARDMSEVVARLYARGSAVRGAGCKDSGAARSAPRVCATLFTLYADIDYFTPRYAADGATTMRVIITPTLRFFCPRCRARCC